jgi:DNA-directed RNA polymerase subunit L
MIESIQSILPSINVVEKDDNFIKLEIKNVHFSFLNSIRRILLTEIPTMTIEKVILEKNSSCMNEDMIAHRLSLLPLVCPNINRFKFQRECSCKMGCIQCEAEFTMEVHSGDQKSGIYCSDLISKHNLCNVLTYPFEKNGILLLRLEPNEEVKLKAIAVKGTGSVHSKFSSVQICTFQRIESDHSHFFSLETNQNVKAIHLFFQALFVIHEKISQIYRELPSYRVEESIYRYSFPFCDTIMNILMYTVLENFDIEMCFYKRRHYFESECDFVIEDSSLQTIKEVESVIKKSLSIIESQCKLLESSFSESYFGISFDKKE